MSKSKNFLTKSQFVAVVAFIEANPNKNKGKLAGEELYKKWKAQFKQTEKKKVKDA